MLSLTQLLTLELGGGCNLGGVHTHCPNRSKQRFAHLNSNHQLGDEMIVECAVKAYREYHFQGLLGWNYYNEPLLEMDRMFGLMDRISEAVPEARFSVWTNGTLFPKDCHRFNQFAVVTVTKYDGINYPSLDFHPNIVVKPEMFDTRMEPLPPRGNESCLRPFVELIFDCFANHHPCCNDWQGFSTLGNLYLDGFDAIVERWRTFQEETYKGNLTNGCKECGVRYVDIQGIDRRSLNTIASWIDEQKRKEPENGERIAYAAG
jgi:hypothetical protein